MIPSDIKGYYKLHSKFYDITRWTFLFGRNSISNYFPELKSDVRILDLGCGTGKHLQRLLKKYPEAHITGIDQSEYMLDIAKRSTIDSVQIKNENYSKSSFSQNEFDFILCSYSLTMFDTIETSIKNIKTHLKPTGRLLVVDFDSTPFNWFSRWMKINHVSFEPNLFNLLENEFEIIVKDTQKAYLGLYNYTIIEAKI